jgi:hypothetical protein
MAEVQKVGVAWNRKFKNGKEGIKISINKEIYIAYPNKQVKKDTDPHYVICKFVDEPVKDVKK